MFHWGWLKHIQTFACSAGVLSRKSRLLVTNQLQYLPQADKIIYIESGRVIGQGSYEKMSLIPGFKSLLNEFNSKADEQAQPEETAATAAMQQDQMFSELNAAEGHADAVSSSTVHKPHAVHTPALSVPVTNAVVSEAFADSAAPGAAIQRNLLVNDADAVEPLHHNVQLIRQESAEEDAGLDLDDAVTRQASGELRRYTLDPAAARSGGAYDISHPSHNDHMDRINSNESAGFGAGHGAPNMTPSQKWLALAGGKGQQSGRSHGSWSGSFRRPARDGASRTSFGASRRSLDTSRKVQTSTPVALLIAYCKGTLRYSIAAPQYCTTCCSASLAYVMSEVTVRSACVAVWRSLVTFVVHMHCFGNAPAESVLSILLQCIAS